MAEHGVGSRRALVELSRDEIEDKHLRLLEENMVLKKHVRSQEDKMKRMATKLLKLTADEKSHSGQRAKVDDEKVSDMESRLRDLERKNESLASKNVVLKHQLGTKSKRHTPYDYVRSRISSGVPLPGPKKSQKLNYDSSSGLSGRTRVLWSDVGTQCDVEVGTQCEMEEAGPPVRSVATTPTCHNLLERVREDNQGLESEVVQLKTEMIGMAAEIVSYKEKLRLMEKQLEEEKLVVRQEMQQQIAQLQSDKTDQEVEMMKVNRQVRDANSRLQNLRTKHSATEKNLDIMKMSNSKILEELERLNAELKQERARVVELEVKARSHDSDQQTIAGLEEMVGDVKRERDALKDSNRDLSEKLELSGVRHKAKVRSLQDQLQTAEETRDTASMDRLKNVKLLTAEKEVSRELDEELRRTRDLYHKLREEFDQLQGRLKFFDKETSVDWSEVEEALAVVRSRKDKGTLDEVDRPSNLGTTRQCEEELQEVRVWHAETVNELEKTRKLLQMQHTINKDYKAEVESLKAQLEDQESRHHDDLKEQARMMDIKTARATELENRLKDIAYGTRQYQLEGGVTKEGGRVEEVRGVDVVLEHGQNLLQLGVQQVVLSSQALTHLSSSVPAIFISIQFSDYEVQVTPVMQGPRPNYEFTANFVVTLDDTFVKHLQKGHIRVELHQALGLKYQPLGFCQIRCHDLIGTSGGKFHGRGQLVGMEPLLSRCVDVGSVEYWMRLKLPISHSAKWYQDRGKALAMISTLPAAPVSSHTPSILSQGPDYNELTVTIRSCQGLPAVSPHHTPSPYVMYKFYSFPDHDTNIIKNTASPRFTDIRHFPVSMDAHLHGYLSSESLEVYVFDDDEQEGEQELPGYVGMARVPLSDLSQGKHISGSFELKQLNGDPAGLVELSLQWKLPYNVRQYSPPGTPHTIAVPISIPSPYQAASKTPPTTMGLPTPTHHTEPLASVRRISEFPKPHSSEQSPASSLASAVTKTSAQARSGSKPPSSASVVTVKPGKHSKKQSHRSISSHHLNNSLPQLRRGPIKKSDLVSGAIAASGSGRSEDKSDKSTPEVRMRLEETEGYLSEDFDQVSSEDGSSSALEADSSKGIIAGASGKLEGVKGSLDTSFPERVESTSRSFRTHTKDSPGRDSGSSFGTYIKDSPPSGTSSRTSCPSLNRSNVKHPRSSVTSESHITVSSDKVGSVKNEAQVISPMVDRVKKPPVLSTPVSSTLVSSTPVSQSTHQVLFVGEKSEQQAKGDVEGEDTLSMCSESDGSRREGEGQVGAIESEESVEEDLAEELTDEDTMFEDTLHNYEEDDNSALSDLSNDQGQPTKVLGQSQKAHTGRHDTPLERDASEVERMRDSGQVGGDYSSDGTLTESEDDGDGKPITSAVVKNSEDQSSQVLNQMTVSIHSFTTETGSPITKDAAVTSVFVECEFLDLDTAELETTSVLKPAEGQKAEFGFRKDLTLTANHLTVLGDLMKSGDKSKASLSFTLVSDPGDEGNCEELGVATYNLHQILQSGEDVIQEDIDVLGMEKDSEVVGFLTVSIEAHKLLMSLS